MTFSSSISILLLNPSKESFVSYIVLLISKISIWLLMVYISLLRIFPFISRGFPFTSWSMVIIPGLKSLVISISESSQS